MLGDRAEVTVRIWVRSAVSGSITIHARWYFNVDRRAELTVIHLHASSRVGVPYLDSLRQTGVLGNVEVHRTLGLLVIVGVKLVPVRHLAVYVLVTDRMKVGQLGGLLARPAALREVAALPGEPSPLPQVRPWLMS